MYSAVVMGLRFSPFAAYAVGANLRFEGKKPNLAKITYVDFILASWLCLTAGPKCNETVLNLYS